MEKLGKYEIVDKIGVGGFGVVYKGYDPHIKRHVAIKTCSAEDRETRDRFSREAEIAGNLQHRHIVTVFEFGFHGDVPYLVQEFLSGEDLDHKIRRGDAIPLADKLRWLTEVARGLEVAHGRGVVHRDIKPANIRIQDDGHAKILDFGIAKLAQQQSTLTQAGVTLGTASYLAPEQIRGDAIDVRTDIFSFGVLSYELLTYERPFRAQEISATFYKILNERPAPIVSRAPECPPELERVVLCCLEKDPAKRWSPTSELVLALERLDPRSSSAYAARGESRDSAPNLAREEKTAPIPVAAPAPMPVSPTQRTTALSEFVLETPKSGPRTETRAFSPARMRPRGRRWPRYLGAAASLLIVAAAALVLAGPRIPGFDRVLESFVSPSIAAGKSGTPTTGLAALSKKSEKRVATRPKDPASSPAEIPPPVNPPTVESPGVAPVETVQVPAPAPEPTVVEPPKAGVVRVGPAWDPTMTVSVAGKRYRLDRELAIELPPGALRLDFKLQTSAFVFERPVKLQLAASATERVAIPIARPGRMTIQPHLNARPGTIRLDGKVEGLAPLRGRYLQPGDHLVELFPASGATTAPAISQTVPIRSDVETIVTFDVDSKIPLAVRERPLAAP